MIETQRTYIREFIRSDTEAVLALTSNKLVTKYTGDAHTIETLIDAQSVIENIWQEEYKKYGYGRWAVVNKTTKQVIGFCGLKFHKQMEMPDIGYRFLPEFWGKSYASETTKACINYCRDELNIIRFYGDAMEQNIASIKVLKKLGLRFNCFVKVDTLDYMRFSLSSRSMLNINQFYK